MKRKKKKCLKSLQMNIKIVLAKNVNTNCILNQRSLFNSLILRMFIKKTFKCLLTVSKFQTFEIDNATFYFLIFVVKI